MQFDFLLLRGDQSHSRSAYREIRVGLKEAELLFQFTRAPTVIRVEARDQREPRCHEAAIERMSKPLISSDRSMRILRCASFTKSRFLIGVGLPSSTRITSCCAGKVWTETESSALRRSRISSTPAFLK